MKKNAQRVLAGLLILVSSVLATPPVRAAEGKKVVNINSADSSQLTMLPRVGQSLAQRIVDYRKENGPFKQTEDLMLVGGIGEKMFEGLKAYVTLSGETTLDQKPHGSRSGKGAKGAKGSKSGSKSAKGAGAAPKSAAAKPSSRSASKSAARSGQKSGFRTGARAVQKKGSH